MSNDTLIRDLAAGLVPVRRRSPRREGFLLLALAAIELALIVGLGLMRHDMGHRIGSPFMLWRLGGLAILAGISATVAIRSFAPPASSRQGVTFALAVAGLVMIGGAFVTSPADNARSLLDRIAPADGIVCAIAIVVLALPMMAMLAVLMRRAAPAFPERSALASGLAAGSCGALVFAVCCPMNDPLYIVTWYAVGCTAVTMLARWLLPMGFRL